jgi:hypothetical protein
MAFSPAAADEQVSFLLYDSQSTSFDGGRHEPEAPRSTGEARKIRP